MIASGALVELSPIERKLCNRTSGDTLLQSVAAALRKAVRQEDLVARIGGDEFALIAIGGAERAKPLADRIREAVEPLGVGISIGWAVAGIEGNDPDELLRLADSRMYLKKTAGKAPRGIRALDLRESSPIPLK